MTRTIDDIRRDWSDPTHCLRESDEADVRVLLEAHDFVVGRLSMMVERHRGLVRFSWQERLRANKAERELAELRASLPGPLATWFRVEAFALVERELREHELTVSVGGDPEHFVIVWEGDHPTGLTLLQAVEELEGTT